MGEKRRRAHHHEIVTSSWFYISFGFISSAEKLTVDISGGKFPEGMRGDVDVWHTVQDVEQGLGQPEKVTEAVEAEVNELPGQFDDLKGQLVSLLVREGPRRVNDVLQVKLHEVNGRLKEIKNSMSLDRYSFSSFEFQFHFTILKEKIEKYN